MRIVDSSGSVFGELDSLPGCTAICVSHAVFGVVKGLGRGGEAHKERIRLMRSLGYEVALCTVNEDNKPQLHILEKNGWKKLLSFANDKTGHTVALYAKDLSEEDLIETRV